LTVGFLKKEIKKIIEFIYDNLICACVCVCYNNKIIVPVEVMSSNSRYVLVCSSSSSIVVISTLMQLITTLFIGTMRKIRGPLYSLKRR